MSDDGRWDECPNGLLADLSADLRARRRKTQTRPILAAVGMFLFIGAGYAVLAGLGGAAEPLNCKETIPLLAEYDQGKLGADKSARVSEHLAHCPSCRKRYKEEFPEEARRQQQPSLALIAWGDFVLTSR